MISSRQADVLEKMNPTAKVLVSIQIAHQGNINIQPFTMNPIDRQKMRPLTPGDMESKFRKALRDIALPRYAIGGFAETENLMEFTNTSLSQSTDNIDVFVKEIRYALSQIPGVKSVDVKKDTDISIMIYNFWCDYSPDRYVKADLMETLQSQPWKPGDRVRVHHEKLKLHEDWHQDMINRDDYLDNVGTLQFFHVDEPNPLVKVVWDRTLKHPNDKSTNASYWHLPDLERA